MENGFELRTIDGWSWYHLPALGEAGIVHGFMTKSSDPVISDPNERKRFVESLGAETVVVMWQEHGDAVHTVEEGERPVTGDGLVLRERGVIGVIKTADCLPVILYAPRLPVVAIVHAGWRGTARKITQKALRAIMAMGAKRDEIGTLIGPGIGPCCYEVGEEVVREFGEAGFGTGVFFTRGTSTFLDLKKANRELIEDEGIGEIHDIGLCTLCRQDLFFSARGDAQGGRQINFVLLEG